MVKDDSPLSALDRAHIFSWLEYEETKVKPAITSGVDINLLLQILARLESHLSSSSTLSSKSSLPDLILAASLAPLFSIGSHKHRDAAITALPKTALWFDAIFKSELMVNALKSLKAGAVKYFSDGCAQILTFDYVTDSHLLYPLKYLYSRNLLALLPSVNQSTKKK